MRVSYLLISRIGEILRNDLTSLRKQVCLIDLGALGASCRLVLPSSVYPIYDSLPRSSRRTTEVVVGPDPGVDTSDCHYHSLRSLSRALTGGCLSPQANLVGKGVCSFAPPFTSMIMGLPLFEKSRNITNQARSCGIDRLATVLRKLRHSYNVAPHKGEATICSDFHGLRSQTLGPMGMNIRTSRRCTQPRFPFGGFGPSGPVG